MRVSVQCYQLGSAYRTVFAKTHPIGLMAQNGAEAVNAGLHGRQRDAEGGTDLRGEVEDAAPGEAAQIVDMTAAPLYAKTDEDSLKPFVPRTRPAR